VRVYAFWCGDDDMATAWRNVVSITNLWDDDDDNTPYHLWDGRMILEQPCHQPRQVSNYEQIKSAG
jgi:hypothetical protein